MSTRALPNGRSVAVATVIDREVWIELLINRAGQYGTMTAHGPLFRKDRAELEKTLRFVFTVAFVQVLRTTLAP